MRLWVRIGECNQCGECCDPKTFLKRIRNYLDAGISINVLDGVELQHGGICPHFKRDGNGKAWCGIYPDRPRMCRTFPRTPLDIMELPKCSYRFVSIKRDVKYF